MVSKFPSLSSSSMRVAALILLLLALAAPAWAACTWGNASFNEHGRLQTVHIYRDGTRIATINRSVNFDMYYVDCNGVPPHRSFATPNDAAWAACERCP